MTIPVRTIQFNPEAIPDFKVVITLQDCALQTLAMLVGTSQVGYRTALGIFEPMKDQPVQVHRLISDVLGMVSHMRLASASKVVVRLHLELPLMRQVTQLDNYVLFEVPRSFPLPPYAQLAGQHGTTKWFYIDVSRQTTSPLTLFDVDQDADTKQWLFPNTQEPLPPLEGLRFIQIDPTRVSASHPQGVKGPTLSVYDAGAYPWHLVVGYEFSINLGC